MKQLYWQWYYGHSAKPTDLKDVHTYVREGWAPLVTKLIEDLFELGWDGILLQIKVKFGGLRFYTASLPPGGQDLVSAAERRSLETCEVCGAVCSTLVINHWSRTRCEEHSK